MEDQVRTAAFIVLGCGVIFFLILAIVLFVVKYQRRVLRNELTLRDLRNRQQLEVFNAAIEAEEKQRELIADNLHDTINPSLALVERQLRNAAAEAPEELKEVISNCAALIKSNQEGLREAIYNLTPKTLRHLGLAKAIEHLVFDIRKAKTVSASFNTRGEVPSQTHLEAKQLNIFRIVQEIMHNILKHAACSRIVVNYETSVNTLKLEILYDGSGISDEDVETLKKKGLGLASMLSRTMILGGLLSFTCGKDRMNAVSLTVPLVS